MVQIKQKTDLIPLAKAAEDLAQLYIALEAGGEVNEELKKLFDDAIIEKGRVVSAAVDRRIYFLERAKFDVAHAEEQASKWKIRKEIIENAIENLKEDTKELVKNFSELKFEGDAGAFVMQKNGGERALTLSFKTDKKTLSSLIPIDIVKEFEIPPKYLILSQYIQLDVEALKVDLNLVGNFNWAKLEERGEHVRVRV